MLAGTVVYNCQFNEIQGWARHQSCVKYDVWQSSSECLK